MSERESQELVQRCISKGVLQFNFDNPYSINQVMHPVRFSEEEFLLDDGLSKELSFDELKGQITLTQILSVLKENFSDENRIPGAGFSHRYCVEVFQIYVQDPVGWYDNMLKHEAGRD